MTGRGLRLPLFIRPGVSSRPAPRDGYRARKRPAGGTPRRPVIGSRREASVANRGWERLARRPFVQHPDLRTRQHLIRFPLRSPESQALEGQVLPAPRLHEAGEDAVGSRGRDHGSLADVSCRGVSIPAPASRAAIATLAGRDRDLFVASRRRTGPALPQSRRKEPGLRPALPVMRWVSGQAARSPSALAQSSVLFRARSVRSNISLISASLMMSGGQKARRSPIARIIRPS